jgi:hypothetical protein
MRTIEEVLQEFKDQGLCLEPKDENGCSVDILSSSDEENPVLQGWDEFGSLSSALNINNLNK